MELYNVQQQLAKLQEQLEKGHDNMMAVAKLKDQKEKERDVVVSQFEGDKAKVDELRRKCMLRSKAQTFRVSCFDSSNVHPLVDWGGRGCSPRNRVGDSYDVSRF